MSKTRDNKNRSPRKAQKGVSLVCTHGDTPLVLTEMLDLLLEKGETVKRMKIFHTTHPGSVEGVTKCKHWIEKNRKVSVALIPLTNVDIFTEEDSNDLLVKMIEEIDREVHEGCEVIVSIAGGRKTMSAIGFLAACLRNVKAVYHVSVKEGVDAGALFETYGYKVPTRLIRLTHVPHVRLGPVVDRLGLSLGNPSEVPHFIERLDSGIEDDLRFRLLHEEFHKIIGTYEALAHAVGKILEQRLKDEGIKFDAIHVRTKKFASFIEKATRLDEKGHRKYSDPLSDIEDLAGVRPVLYYKSDLPLLEKIIKKEFETKFERNVPNDLKVYESDHYIVQLKPERLKMPEYRVFATRQQGRTVPMKCEIQVRTIFDHAWAQFEHSVVYKGKKERKEKLKEEVYRRLKVFLDQSKDIVDEIKIRIDRGKL